ncbi:MAG: site-2 protease family protein [Clostridia bacterium]|nr:site-2 protease family protein [Clostridia bacterium]
MDPLRRLLCLLRRGRRGGQGEDDPRAYGKQPAWKRMITVAMGPVMNFVLALVVAIIFCWSCGVMTVYPIIGGVEEGGPAQAAGVQPYDYVLTLNGVDVGVYAEDVMGADASGRMTAFKTIIANAAPGETLHMTLLRPVDNGEGQEPTAETVEVEIVPFWDEAMGQSRIGISYGAYPLDEARTRLGLVEGVRHGWNICVESGAAVFNVLGRLFTDKEVQAGLTGPVGVIDQTRQIVQVGGVPSFLSLMVLISVNLGLMNLLPIPGLDGARFIFHTIEAVRGKPIKQEVEAGIHLAGLALLMLLIVLMTGRDLFRLF